MNPKIIPEPSQPAAMPPNGRASSNPANHPIYNPVTIQPATLVTKTMKEKEKVRSIVSTILLLVAAPLLALCINAFIFQSYEVDGPSMETTLHNGDRLIVNKIGKTWSRIDGKDYIPKRGTIVIFKKSSLDVSLNGSVEQKQLIKRVIGLPGERVIIKDGRITIINNAHPDGYDPDSNQKYSNTYKPPTAGTIDLTVPAGEIFVCGDNRGNSLDSRYFGTVKSKDIVGSLSLRIYPFGTVEHFTPDKN